MTKFGYAIIPVLALGSTLARASTANGTSTRQRSALAGVMELDRPVTCAETKISLGELVGRVAAETGTNLTATRDVADEPIAIIVKALPARELLDQLAELLSRPVLKCSKGRSKSAHL